MTRQGLPSRLGRYPFVRTRLALSSIALVMATGCLFGDMKPKKAGGNAGQAGIAGWQNGTTMGNGQESAIGGTRGSSNDTRDHGGATSVGGTTATTSSIGGANQGGAATNKDATEVVGGVGTSSGTSSPGIDGAPTVLSPSGGMTGNGATVAIAGSPSTGGAAPTGGKPGIGGEPPSCVGLAKCWADSCCTSLRMDGGTFKMGRSLSGTDAFSNGGADELPEHDAAVSAFALDKYEVTVGRFRKFVDNFTAWRKAGNPKVGDGKNASVEAASRDKTGWGQSWTLTDSDLPKDADALKAQLDPNGECNWTPNAGTDEEETYPMNCVSWFVAFAFCVWDGGRLPTEAEWEYAAAGGQANRLYPWAGILIDSKHANYADSANTPKKAVGSYPAGVGLFGHMDLAGSMWEWVLDRYKRDYYGTLEIPALCDNCVSFSGTGFTRRGGSWGSSAFYLRAANRRYTTDDLSRNFGVRCARPTQ